MSEVPLLACRGLRAGWGATHVLDAIDLTLGEAETLAVLGRNGVGKTTLLCAIMGRAVQYGGTITFAGKDIRGTSITARARSGIALVPQERDLSQSDRKGEPANLGASGAGRWIRSTTFSLGLRNAFITMGATCRVESSRCCQLPARS